MTELPPNIENATSERHVLSPELAARNRVKEELVQSLYKSDVYQDVGKMISVTMRKIGDRKNVSIYPEVRGRWEGTLFEEMAMNYYYTHLKSDSENKNLAEFLKSVLTDPNLREISFYEGEEVVSGLKILPDGISLSNSDGLLIDVATDEETGKKVAKIVGVIDSKINGHMSEHQLSEIKKHLPRLVRALKPHYGEITSGLDIDQLLPEEIDIVSEDKLNFKIIRPQVSPEMNYTKEFQSHHEKIYIPITREEISNIVNAMMEDARNNRNQK